VADDVEKSDRQDLIWELEADS